MRSALAIVVLAVAACWSTSAPPPAAPRLPPHPIAEYVPPRRPQALPLDEIEAAFVILGRFRDDMCSCSDATCANQVKVELETWGREFESNHHDLDLDADQKQKAQELISSLSSCLSAAGGSWSP